MTLTGAATASGQRLVAAGGPGRRSPAWTTASSPVLSRPPPRRSEDHRQLLLLDADAAKRPAASWLQARPASPLGVHPSSPWAARPPTAHPAQRIVVTTASRTRRTCLTNPDAHDEGPFTRSWPVSSKPGTDLDHQQVGPVRTRIFTGSRSPSPRAASRRRKATGGSTHRSKGDGTIQTSLRSFADNPTRPWPGASSLP